MTRPRTWLAIAVIVLPTVCGATPLPAFVDALRDSVGIEWRPRADATWSNLCEQHDLDPTDETAREAIDRLLFLHDLLTGTGAVDGVRGGLLGIPYFWHWVNPNPRHEIIWAPTGERLADMPPGEGFGRYRTRADIDRVPILFWSDLVAPEARYDHPDTGPFRTFGWCSEREMAFTALTCLWGYRCKIVQQGIHTWSEVGLECRGDTGEQVRVSLRVDNTFDTVNAERLGDVRPWTQWQEDNGSGESIDWYNRHARSTQTLSSLANLDVPAAAAHDLIEKVRDASKSD